MTPFDIASVILGVGVVSGSFGFALGLGARPHVRLRLEGWIHALIAQEVNNFVANIQKNPKFASDLIEPLISSFVGSTGLKSDSVSPKDLKIGGLKIPAWAVQLGLAYLDRKQPHSMIAAGETLSLTGEG
jgi:hypothetical protein